MTKYYANTVMQLSGSATPGQLIESELSYFEINGNKYSISVDANAPAGEPISFISIDGMKIAVESEHTGYIAEGQCFDTAEIASDVTGHPTVPGYIDPAYVSFVEIA